MSKRIRPQVPLFRVQCTHTHTDAVVLDSLSLIRGLFVSFGFDMVSILEHVEAVCCIK